MASRRLPRSWRIAWLVVNVGLGVAVFVVALMASFVFWTPDEGAIDVPVRVTGVATVDPPGVRLADVQGTMSILDPTFAENALDAVLRVGQFPMLVVVLLLLRQMLGSIAAGEVFAVANVGRLRRIGLVLVAGSVLVEVVDAAARQQLYEGLPPSEGVVGVHGFALPFAYVVAGVLAYVLAEVFARGVALREDVEATI